MTDTARRLEPGQELDPARRAGHATRRCSSSWSPRPAGCTTATRKVAQEWFPHDYIPYRLGRDFDKEPWTPDQPRLTGVAQTAFEIGLLTEDNLPSYHRLIHGMFGRGDGAWINWVGRWTAEEGRHAIVLRDYLTVTRNIDPIMLERGRMTQLQQGYDHASPTTLRGLAYVAFQELATRIAHRNTGRYSDDPVADKIMVRIAADENLHMVFYRDILGAALKVQPSAAVRAIVDEVLAFEMPGAGIPGLHPQGGPDRQGRHLRPARPPRRGPDADPAPLADLRARRARRGRRGCTPATRRAPREARRGREAVRGEGRDLERAADRLDGLASHPRTAPRSSVWSTCQTAPRAVTMSHRTPTTSSAKPTKNARSPRVEASGSSAWRRNRARLRELDRNAKS